MPFMCFTRWWMDELNPLFLFSQRYETLLKDMERKSEQHREVLTSLQQEYQRAQGRTVGKVWSLDVDRQVQWINPEGKTKTPNVRGSETTESGLTLLWPSETHWLTDRPTDWHMPARSQQTKHIVWEGSFVISMVSNKVLALFCGIYFGSSCHISSPIILKYFF